MARKNLLGALIESKLPAGNPDAAAPETVRTPAAVLTSQGAIGAVSRSIEQLKQQVSEAGRLQERLAAGQHVVELDPILIDPSPIADRLGVSAQSEAELAASIAEHGQQVPILVRPHPASAGRYQVAYGHRRLGVARDLGRSVRAVVRRLSDEELVVAQGSENSARADLSFIERALYAASLEQAGFRRETIMAALSLDKTALSKLIAVASRIPGGAIRAIGPAPKIGRDRWLMLADLVAARGGEERLEAALAAPGFTDAESDQRFERVLKAMQSAVRPKAAAAGAIWRDEAGRTLGRIQETPRQLVLALDRKSEPGFAEYLRAALPQLLDDFRRRQARS